MKKLMMMAAMLVACCAMQAQKFHDVEANEAKGPVKSITTSTMGMNRTVTFDENGKIISGDVSDAVYDENGYPQSAKMSVQGQTMPVKYTWPVPSSSLASTSNRA